MAEEVNLDPGQLRREKIENALKRIKAGDFEKPEVLESIIERMMNDIVRK